MLRPQKLLNPLSKSAPDCTVRLVCEVADDSLIDDRSPLLNWLK